MSITKLENSEDFGKFISVPTVTAVSFYAPWSEQCELITDVFNELLKLPEIISSGTKMAVIDAEQVSEVSLKYEVTAVPTVIIFKNGKEIDKVEGANAAQTTATIKKHSLAMSDFADVTTKPPLEERLKALINKHKVMVFIKGTRDAPRCGFTRTLIQILNGIGVEYETFDILTDEEVRQGLKEYSNWPTYPQLYVKGELIGGLDIIKELQANGELEATLNA